MAEERKQNDLFQSVLPTGPIKSLYSLLTDKQKQDLKRTSLKITSQVVREGIELSRMITDPTQEETESTEKFLENLYAGAIGAENLERVQRGDREVTSIKEPESVPLQVTSDIGSFAASMAGIGKFTKPFTALESIKKVTQAAPKTAKTLGFIAKGEAATQLAINPYQENLANILGSMIEDSNEGVLGDVEKYILEPVKSSQEKSELENRLGLLAEGLILTGAAGIGITAVSKAPEVKRNFINALTDIKNSSEEAKQTFLNIVKRQRRQDKYAYDTSLQKRQDAIVEAERSLFPDRNYSLGDIEALREGNLFTNKFSTIPLVRNISNKLAKTFTTRGGRSKLLHENYLKSQNANEKWELTIDHVGRNLEAAIDNIVVSSKQKKDIVLDDLNKVLFSDFRVPTVMTSKKTELGISQDQGFLKALKDKFPEEVHSDIIRARDLQDELSRLLLRAENVSDADKKIIKDQLGFYVRRSFKLFEDPTYRPSSTQVNDARRFIKRDIESNNPGISKAELQLQIQSQMELLAGGKSKYNNFTSGYESFRAVQDKILQSKVDIPKPIQNYLGEITDPVQKLATSMTKISRFVTDLNFHNQAYRDGKDIYFFNKKDARPGFSKKIKKVKGAKIQPFGDLSGKYTSPELHYYYTSKYQKGLLVEGDGLGKDLYRGLIFLKSQSQKSKTVRRFGTHIKNIFGGIQISGANGLRVFSGKGLSQSSKAVWSQLSKTTDIEKQNYTEELAGYGLLNKGPVGRELQSLIKEGVNVKNPLLTDFAAIGKKVKNNQPVKGLLKFDDKLQETYIAEDDFFKINMYESEKQHLKKFNDVLPKDSKFNYIRFNSQDTINQEAANLTRNALPNYDLVPDNIKALRGVPFVGRFFSFLTESTRLAMTIPTQASKEITLGNKLIKDGAEEAGKILRNRGLDRAAGYSVFGVGGSYGAVNVANYTAGVTSDFLEDIKTFSADYEKNDTLAVTINDDGVPIVYNFSPWDAFDFPRKPFQTLIHSISNKDNLTADEQKSYMNELLSETLTPFFGESITQEALSDYFLSNGRDSRGVPIKSPFDKTKQFDDSGTTLENIINPENLTILFANMVEALEPGTLTDIRKYTKTFGKEETELDQDIYPKQQIVKLLTGFGGRVMNKEHLERLYDFKISDFKRNKSKRSGSIYNGISDDTPQKKFVDNFLRQNQKYYKDYAKLHRVTQSAEKLNLATLTLLDDAGVSKSDQYSFISNKRYFNPLNLTENMQIEMLQSKGELSNNYYDIMLEVDEISKILRQLPVLIGDEITDEKEDLSSSADKIFEGLRENLSKGGLVEGEDNVPFTKEDPADRINPYTGEPYQEQMSRLGFSHGGLHSTLEEANQNRLNVYNYLKSKNLRPEAIVGIMANIDKETGREDLGFRGSFSYKQQEDIKEDKDIGQGLFQRTTKLHKEGYKNFSEENKLEDSNEADIDYFLDTILNPNSKMREKIGGRNLDEIKESFEKGTTEEITEAINNKWLKPGTYGNRDSDPDAHLKNLEDRKFRGKRIIEELNLFEN